MYYLCLINQGRPFMYIKWQGGRYKKYCGLNSPFPFFILNFKIDAILSKDLNMYQMAVTGRDLYLKFVAEFDRIYI